MPPRISPQFQAILNHARLDKNGISVAKDGGELDLGHVDALAAGGFQKSFDIKVLTPSTIIRIVDHRWTSTGRRPFDVSITSSTLQHGLDAQIIIRLLPASTSIGRYADQLEITFEIVASRKRFAIVRPVTAVLGDPGEFERLKPQAPYVPRRKARREWGGKVIGGVAPTRLQAIAWRSKLPMSKIPVALSNILSSQSGDDIVPTIKTALIPKPLSVKNYAIYFKILLWIEETRAQQDLEIYDLDNAQLDRHGVFYNLLVPGLAEKRPSVLIGDRMLVQRYGAPDQRSYEGHVHYIRESEVGLQFHSSFPRPVPAQRHNVHFLLNRIPIRRQHQILNMLFRPRHIFFPQPEDLGVAQPDNLAIRAFNPLINSNPPQLSAIKAILRRPPGAAPFILFGPPGTGKTVTGVEAIRQILARKPDARILACAPSNSAADIIACRLMDIGRDALFRFYAPSREKKAVPEELLPFTFVNEHDLFSHPPLDVVRRYRVIVATCVSSAFAAGIGLPRGHFSHIFVDEAGQATEPEVMVAVKSMASDATNIVLLGDPKQLGPVIRSSVARELGLEVSYMERLMNREVYNAGQSSGTSFVKLIKNYRSHGAILMYPNERFYSGDLETCGNPQSINSLRNSPLLATPRFPVVFHAMSGQDAREASSPSFFNVEEVLQVKEYIRGLLNNPQFPVEGSDIGIIAPYRAQCQKIRASLREIASGVKVGSTEEFQGQERRVIIISTVRSSRDYITYDMKHTLGFVANPRRLNVAVTRAKAMLIIVGDPAVLSLDPLWRGFLNYIHFSGGWKGAEILWDPNEPIRADGGYDVEMRERGLADMDAFARRMEEFTLEGLEAGIDGGDVDSGDERPWREVE